MGKRKGRRSEIPETLNPRKGEEDEGLKDPEEGEKSGFFACYLLTSLCPRYKGHTYIGFTVNPQRRIRQHNGELCSGAWRTKKKRPWEMVLCIYGFPTNVAALQFEWAWQHPVESLAVRKAAVGFKSLGGLANKIKLAYTMLTLPAWNELKLNVNFFSTKYTKHYAGCPSLPNQMRVHIRPMDELPCYTEGEDDMFKFEHDLWDGDEEEEPNKCGGSCNSDSRFEEVMVPVRVSADHYKNEEATCVSETERPSNTNGSPVWLLSDTPERSFMNYCSVVSPTMEDELPSYTKGEDDMFKFEHDLWDDDEEEPDKSGGSCNSDLRFEDVTMPVRVSADHYKNEEATCVSETERPSNTNDSPVWLLSDTPERSFTNYCSVVSPTTEDEHGRVDEGGHGFETSASGFQVEVIDVFTPSPEYRTRKKRGTSVVCPEIIDLTQSPICV